MKKGKSWLLVLLVSLPLLCVGAGVLALSVLPGPRLNFELQRQLGSTQPGEEPDLSGAMQILRGLDAETQWDALKWSIGQGGEKVRAVSLMATTAAARLHEAGELPDEVLAQAASALLRCHPVSSEWPDYALRALPAVLSLTEEDLLLQMLTTAETTAESDVLQGILGDTAAQRLSLRQLAEVYRARRAAGLPGELLMKRGLALHTQEEIISALAAESDAECRAALAQAYGLTLSLPDDVLCYLAQARAVGVPAAECYPEGALVAWDLSRLGVYGVPAKVSGESPCYLVVHCTEAEEPFEYRDAPSGTAVDEWRYEGAFPTYYEGNAGRWAETTTVRIDTAVLDATPAKFVPEDLSQLDAIVVFDTRYTAYGLLRLETYNIKSYENESRTLGKLRDYRSYRVEQCVDVYDLNNRLLWRFGEQMTEPTGMQNRTDGFRTTYSDRQIKAGCIPAVDMKWQREQQEKLMLLLENCGGDLWQAVRTDMAAQ